MKRKAAPKPTIITIQENIVAPWSPTCPACGEPIKAQAAVDEFKPDDWVSFWGYKDSRWRKCDGVQGARPFIHFYILLNGQLNHRLAWLPAPDDEPAAQLDLLGDQP
jgi:hypothetical protein